MSKNQPVLTALLTGLCLCVSACSRSAQGGAPQGFPAMHVQTQSAQEQKVGDYTEYLATLKSRSSSMLQPEVEGQILKIFVKSGDHVQPGQVLMEIDPRRQEATVNSGEANSRSRRAALDYNAKELERRKGPSPPGSSAARISIRPKVPTILQRPMSMRSIRT